MALKIVDFSDGIRSDNIQYNFNDLQNQINYDRSFIVGSGIAKGLKIDIDEQTFTISVSDGSIVDPNGALIDIQGKSLKVDLPSTILQTIIKDYVVQNKTITLVDTPYAANGRYIAAINPALNDYHNDINITTLLGSEVTDFSTTDNANIFRINVNDNTIVTVRYYIAYDVIYTIYINTDNEIQFCQGVSSTSPSEYGLKDFKYKLGNVFIKTNVNGYTTISTIQDMSDRVNIYTNENGELYIGGKPFSSFTYIYTVKPTNPKENDIWYNGQYGNNQLYVYRIIDGIGQWCPMDKYIYSLHNHSKLWSPTDTVTYTADYMDKEYFLFNKDEQNMFFEPATESLKVVVDNTILHSDQYEEVTINDINALITSLDTESARYKYLQNLGYNRVFVDSLLYNIDADGNVIGNKDPVCVGFKLTEPTSYFFTKEGYERGPYVEAIVTQSYVSPSIQRKTDRISTYVTERSITIGSSAVEKNEVLKTILVTTEAPFNYNENQLEVYINGVKQIKDVDFNEISLSLTSKSTQLFKINKDLTESDVITYRVNTSVYSYDELKNDNSKYWFFDLILTRVTDDTYLNLPENLALNDKSFVMAFKKATRTILIRKTEAIQNNADYEIIFNPDTSLSKLHILNEEMIPVGESIYLIGLKQKFDGIDNDQSSRILKLIEPGAVEGQLLRVSQTYQGNVEKLKADNITTLKGNALYIK